MPLLVFIPPCCGIATNGRPLLERRSLERHGRISGFGRTTSLDDTMRRLLILTHRYLGIPLSVLFVLWFVTGIAMIYVGGMPALSAQARLEQLPPLGLA